MVPQALLTVPRVPQARRGLLVPRVLLALPTVLRVLRAIWVLPVLLVLRGRTVMQVC